MFPRPNFCETEVIGQQSSVEVKEKQKEEQSKLTVPVITIDPGILNQNSVLDTSPTLDNDQTSSNGKIRVMFCGTYPIGQSNGYSRVVYYIAKLLGAKEDIDLTIYGFQNFKQTAGSDARNDIPARVKMHDAFATEEPKRNGFGEKEVGAYLKKNPQDIVIIFNDLVVTAMLVQTIVNELTPAERSRFKLVSYLDQVYPYQKKQYIDMLNTYFNAIVTFTPYWRTVARTIGIDKKLPCYVFPHGFDHTVYYPIPRKIARMVYKIPEDAFSILNLNRNQPRKRWDHTMMIMADVIKRYYDLTNAYKASNGTKKKPSPIRLVIGTSMDLSWNLLEILEHELKLLNVPFDFGKECIVAVANPQQLSDRDINIMYNACDIGLNTTSGEGHGLCQSEHCALGSPQVCGKIGGLQDFLNNDNSTLIEPKIRLYIDKHSDNIGGISEIGLNKDFADAIWRYYTDRKLLEKHSKNGRKYLLQHYPWNTTVNRFHKIILDIKNRA